MRQFSKGSERWITCYDTGEKCETYADYLKSDHWANFRAEYFKYHKPVCAKCQSDKRIQLHHLTYERIGCELECDVIALCRLCHKAEHGVFTAPPKRRKPKRKPKIKPKRGKKKRKVSKEEARQVELDRLRKRVRTLELKERISPDQHRAEHLRKAEKALYKALTTPVRPKNRRSTRNAKARNHK